MNTGYSKRRKKTAFILYFNCVLYKNVWKLVSKFSKAVEVLVQLYQPLTGAGAQCQVQRFALMDRSFFQWIFMLEISQRKAILTSIISAMTGYRADNSNNWFSADRSTMSASPVSNSIYRILFLLVVLFYVAFKGRRYGIDFVWSSLDFCFQTDPRSGVSFLRKIDFSVLFLRF